MDWKPSLQPRLSSREVERCLMQGVAPADALSWINDELGSEITQALAANPELFDCRPSEPNFDAAAQQWLVPEEYQNLDIAALVRSRCRNEKDLERVNWELDRFDAQGLLPVLKAVKFVVDTLRTNKIVWGVGRGSSVCSLVLYLLDVHRIDPLRWNLDPNEFFR